MNITEIFTRKNRLLLKAMVSTDFKLRYQQSFLGYIWSVLKPLMLFTIMYLVFVRFLKFGASLLRGAFAGHHHVEFLQRNHYRRHDVDCGAW